MTSTPRLVPDRPSDADKFVALEANLAERYRVCEDTVTPSSILLAVLNAVADVNRAAPPTEATAHPSRGVVDEDAVDVALQAFSKASYEWSQRDLDGRDEPRTRYALRAVVEAIQADLPAGSLGAVDDAAVERALAEYNRADFAWADAMVKPADARHRFAMRAALQAAALPADQPNGGAVLSALITVRDRFFPADQPERDRDADWDMVNGAINGAALPAEMSERVEKALRDALAYVGQRTDGDIATIAERAELWMRESRCLLNEMKELQAALPAVPAVDAIVNRFLGWPLPEDFAPDCGISFDPIFNKGTKWESRHKPVGTNLLSAAQARAMLEYVLATGAPTAQQPLDGSANNAGVATGSRNDSPSESVTRGSLSPLSTLPAVSEGWQPIETAPKDNARLLLLARYNPDTNELQELDFDGIWQSESESWELPQVYWYWASARGIEDPTHWMYQPAAPAQED